MIDKKLFDWSKTYWMNISDIKYGFIGQIYLQKDWGKDWGSILDGDLKKIPFSKDNFFITSLRQFLIEGIPLNQTREYQRKRWQTIVKDLKNGIDNYGYKTEAGFIKMLESKWTTVYNSIKKYGMKSQEQLMREKVGYIRDRDGSDEIATIVDHDGKLLFFNGNHRVACAIILGIKKIPVRVAVRHKTWVDFMLSLYDFNKKSWGAKNKTYQTIDHIDFRDFMSEWSSTYRYNKIKENLGITSGTVLDIGALWGALCQKFETIGFDCTAVERSERMVHIMEKMRIAKDKKFKIILDDMFNLDSYNYDIVLALNIWHHFIKTEQLHEKLRLMIQKIHCKELYFQAHDHQGKLYNDFYRNYKPEDFVKFILQNTNCLNNYKEIGEERSRKLFKLY